MGPAMRSNCLSSLAAELKGVFASIALSDASRCAMVSGASADVSRSSCVPRAGHEVMGTWLGSWVGVGQG